MNESFFPQRAPSSSEDSRTNSPSDGSESGNPSPVPHEGNQSSNINMPSFSSVPVLGDHVRQHKNGYPGMTSGGFLSSNTQNQDSIPKVRPIGITIPTTSHKDEETPSCNAATLPAISQPKHVAPTKSRKSERGLSYLFPSLVDQHLSLLDKVLITIRRHVNNYFLGWSQENLNKLDPLVRPKMVITPEIYKKYCHRNAMKYDSNLQFAMSSTEPWGQEFREKLSSPPSEGGFSSLCEVKQEAGALWRKYGKYKMHNVIKVQMDINQETFGRQPSDPGVVAVGPPPQPQPQPVPNGPYNKNGPPLSNLQQILNNGKQSIPSLAVPVCTNQLIAPLPQLSSGSQHLETKKRDSSHGSAPNSIQVPIVSPSHESGYQHRKRKPDSSLEIESPSSSTMAHDMYPITINSPGDNALSQGSVIDRTEYPANVQSHPLALKVARRTVDNVSYKPDVRSYMYNQPNHHSMMSIPIVEKELLSSHSHAHVTRTDSSRDSGLSSEKATEKDAVSLESLLKPLSKQLSVAEQLHIWVDWARNNSLHNLKEVLQNMPQSTQVQQAVHAINHFFSPEIAQGLFTADKILTSREPWAIEFQERIARPVSCGGFASVEDILVEANKVWQENGSIKNSDKVMTSVAYASVPGEPTASMTHNVSMGAPMLPLHKISHLNHTLHQSGSKPHTGLNDTSDNSLQHSHKDATSNDNLDDNYVAQVGGVLDLSKSSSRTILHKLWASRDILHKRCEENLSVSWHERTREFLPLLKDRVGSAYTIPTTTIGCVLDLALCLLHHTLKD